jgi:hypothetical protein
MTKNAYGILVGEPGGKTELGRPKRRWENTVKIDLRGIWKKRVDWIHLTEDRRQWQALVNTAVSILFP